MLKKERLLGAVYRPTTNTTYYSRVYNYSSSYQSSNSSAFVPNNTTSNFSSTTYTPDNSSTTSYKPSSNYTSRAVYTPGSRYTPNSYYSVEAYQSYGYSNYSAYEPNNTSYSPSYYTDYSGILSNYTGGPDTYINPTKDILLPGYFPPGFIAPKLASCPPSYYA